MEREKIKSEERYSESVYSELDGLLNQVFNSDKTKGLIIVGETSLGKTYRVKKSLEGKMPVKDYIIHSGHATPRNLYIKSYLARNKIQVFDDVDILSNKTASNLLKAMLGLDGIVQWDSSRELPPYIDKMFKFNGKVIILLNELPKTKNNEHLRAVESRVLFYHLKISRTERLSLLYERAETEEIEGTTSEERLALVDWIRDNTDELTSNLNYRLYEKTLNFYVQNRDNWEELAKTQIKSVDEYLNLLIQGCEDEWCETTGKSRRSYFRKRAEAKECHDGTKMALPNQPNLGVSGPEEAKCQN